MLSQNWDGEKGWSKEMDRTSTFGSILHWCKHSQPMKPKEVITTAFIYFIYKAYLRGSLFLRHKTRQGFGFGASVLLFLCDTAPGSWKMLNPLAEMVTSGTGGSKKFSLFGAFRPLFGVPVSA